MGLYQSKTQDRLPNSHVVIDKTAQQRRLSSSLSSVDRASLIEMHLRQQQNRQGGVRIEEQNGFQTQMLYSNRPRWYVEDVTTASTDPSHVRDCNRFTPTQQQIGNHHAYQYECYNNSNALLDPCRLCHTYARNNALSPVTHVDFKNNQIAYAKPSRAPFACSSCSSSSSSSSVHRHDKHLNCHPITIDRQLERRHTFDNTNEPSENFVDFGCSRNRTRKKSETQKKVHRMSQRQKKNQERQAGLYETAASAEGTSYTQILCVNTPDSVAMFMEKFESDIKLLLPYCYHEGRAEASIALCFVSRLTVQDREASQKDTCRFFPRFQASQRDFYFRLIPVGSQDDGLFVVEYYNMPEYRQPTYVFDTHCWIEIEALLRLFFQQGYRYLMKLFPERDLLVENSSNDRKLLDSNNTCSRRLKWSRASSNDERTNNTELLDVISDDSACNTCSRSWSTSLPNL